MARVHIVKNGIKNIVEESIFESKYKKEGWEIDGIKSEVKNSIPKELKTEDEMNNYSKMRRKSTKVFNDNLIKSGDK